jgi:hypothetical protein
MLQPPLLLSIHKTNICHHKQKLDFCRAMGHDAPVSSILLQENRFSPLPGAGFFLPAAWPGTRTPRSGHGIPPRLTAAGIEQHPEDTREGTREGTQCRPARDIVLIARNLVYDSLIFVLEQYHQMIQVSHARSR